MDAAQHRIEKRSIAVLRGPGSGDLVCEDGTAGRARPFCIRRPDDRVIDGYVLAACAVCRGGCSRAPG